MRVAPGGLQEGEETARGGRRGPVHPMLKPMGSTQDPPAANPARLSGPAVGREPVRDPRRPELVQTPLASALGNQGHVTRHVDLEADFSEVRYDRAGARRPQPCWVLGPGGSGP